MKTEFYFLLCFASVMSSPAEESVDDRDKRGTYGTSFSSGPGGYGGYAGNHVPISTIAQHVALRAKAVSLAENSHKAALYVKLRLAQKAQTAQAALLAKEAVVQRLKQQLYDLEAQVELETAQAAEAQQSAAAAQKLAHECDQQVQALTTALHSAKINAARAAHASQVAEDEALLQSQVLYEARQRIRRLEEKLRASEGDLDAAKHIAHKVAAVAQIAKDECCKEE